MDVSWPGSHKGGVGSQRDRRATHGIRRPTFGGRVGLGAAVKSDWLHVGLRLAGVVALYYLILNGSTGSGSSDAMGAGMARAFAAIFSIFAALWLAGVYLAVEALVYRGRGNRRRMKIDAVLAAILIGAPVVFLAVLMIMD